MRVASPARQGFQAILLSTVALGLVGCGLFDIRDPQTPNPGPPEHFATEPDSVLLNFALGVEYEHSGVPALTRALADTFHLQLDPNDALPIYGISTVLLSRSETESGWRAFLRRVVLTNDVEITFGAAEDIQTPDGGSTQIWENVPYSLKLASGTEMAAGKADLTFRQKGDFTWVIARWTDKITSASATLGARIESGSGHPR